MKKVIRNIVSPIILLMAVIGTLLGCSAGGNDVKKPQNADVDVIEGGTTTHTDTQAPKVINSDNLVGFKNNFFLFDENGSEFDASYCFEVKDSESGQKLLTCEKNGQTFDCEIDSAVMSGIQKIIKEYSLANYNGTDKFTAGLPPEYDLSEFYALYDTGETIRFSDNNNPDSEVSKAFLKYFTQVFADCGINDFLPPSETSEVVRFDFTFTDKNMCYIYGESEVPVEELNMTPEELSEKGLKEGDIIIQFRKEPWDRSSHEASEILYADPTSAFYEGLSDLLKELNLNGYVADTYSPSGFSYEDTPEYYEFYVEFAYGNNISGFSEDPETVEAFRPIAQKIMEYLDTYFE